MILFHHKIQKEVLFAAAASTAEKGLGSVATCEHSDVGCVVGEEEDPQTVRGVRRLGEIQVTEDRDGRNEEMLFRDSLEDIFDIAHSKAMEAKTPEEDKAFLEAQREDGRAARCLAWTRS
ncbi:hypothetical protein GWK47_045299 [Chionoecetes opilio]|uniref:Uncharacterized protein n=1 Tax=Chionoecetes opilio TaxID=41210 RepID=A0A8J4Y8A9_CHIOP|nr:hypothetical protein GWK47_045299 [Chionoecetes opilio]